MKREGEREENLSHFLFVCFFCIFVVDTQFQSWLLIMIFFNKLQFRAKILLINLRNLQATKRSKIQWESEYLTPNYLFGVGAVQLYLIAQI